MHLPPLRRHRLDRVLVTVLVAVVLGGPGAVPAPSTLPVALAGEVEDAPDEDAEDAEDVEDVLDDPEPTEQEPTAPPDDDAGPDTETVVTLVAIVLLAFLILAHALYRDPRQHGR